MIDGSIVETATVCINKHVYLGLFTYIFNAFLLLRVMHKMI